MRNVRESQAALFAAALRRLLGESWPLAVVITDAPFLRGPLPGYGPPPGHGPGSGMMKGAGMMMGPGAGGYAPYAFSFVVQARLRDATLVTFDSRQPVEAVNWPYRLTLSLAILLAAVIVLTLFAVRWVTRPLKTLAAAAEQLGENIDRPPLDETGPLEVSRAAHAFNTMQRRLAKYIHDRTRIFAAMSHDLKTPITRLRLRAELLEDAKLRSKFEKDLKEMESMVSGALDFMRGLENQEPAQPVDVMALLQSLRDDARELNGHVRIEGRTQVPYCGKPQALKRCLGNLIDNALKYGRSATVFVQDSRETLELRIRDAGPGIPESELERVFDPFYRLEESRNRETGGTGLGLSIARSIAESHGGSLSLRNHPQGGLEAVLTLARARAGASPRIISA